MKTAFLFSGQGSQSIGMGLDLYQNFQVARSVFQEVDEALKQKLSELMFQGDISELTQTQNAQPAIMAVGMAVVRVLEQELGVPLTDKATFMAGHSLGEYTALCAAGAISLTDTARLLRARGNAMSKADTTGGMTAVLGLTKEQIEILVEQASTQTEQVVIANDNCVGQTIVSGHKNALNRVKELAESLGAKRVLPLAVSGAFHSPYMKPAELELEPVLNGISIQSINIPVVANVTAKPEITATEIKENLLAQMTGTVRWTESAGYMVEQGINTFIECANGKVMTGLMKRLAPNANLLSVGDSAGIENVLKVLT